MRKIISKVFRLNVDKLVYIQFPLHYYSIVSRVRMLRISTATWLAMFAITVALALTMSANVSVNFTREII